MKALLEATGPNRARPETSRAPRSARAPLDPRSTDSPGGTAKRSLLERLGLRTKAAPRPTGDASGAPDGQSNVPGAREAHRGEGTAESSRAKAPNAFAEWFKLRSYKLVGRHLEGERRTLREQLNRADLRMSPGMYLGVIVCAGAAAGLAGLLVGALLFTALLGVAGGLGAGLAVAVLAGGGTAASFPFALQSRIQNASRGIEKELPFSLSELAVLAGIGLSPIVLMRRMAGRPHDPAMTGQFRKVVAMVDTQGMDLVTALAETARQTPSDHLRDTFWDLANLIHQGGDLETFLRNQSDTVLDTVRQSQVAFTDQLGTYADMYITVVLLGLMFLSVGAIIMNAMGQAAGPLTAGSLLTVLAFGGMPLIVIVLTLLLSTAHGRAA